MIFLFIYLTTCLILNYFFKKDINETLDDDYKSLIKFDDNINLKKWHQKKSLIIKNLTILIYPFMALGGALNILFKLLDKVFKVFYKKVKFLEKTINKVDEVSFLFIVIAPLSLFVLFSIIEDKISYKKEFIEEEGKQYTVKTFLNGTKRYFFNGLIHRETAKAVIVNNWQSFDFFLPEERYYMCGKVFDYSGAEDFQKKYLNLKLNDF
jgi:hypothetical protein